ncbi:XTP/dITP diphosphohydrolase [Microbacteriaceae bacterium MWH-Ta3]|nr:XTP/dITP diphosphohydrolase [Microbacteriaceae bacterium MWH-Ta3]
MSEPKPVIVATHNAHKVGEIARTLEPLVGSTIELRTYDGPEPVEDGDTFEANALIKARAAFAHTGIPSLADDSGIVVAALGGAPGIYSARYSEEGTDEANRAKLLSKMDGIEDRSARFVCVVALVTADGEDIVRGEWAGELADTVRGDGGFGYDPLFIPAGETRTAAEFAPLEKAALSHRARALGAIAPKLLARVVGMPVVRPATQESAADASNVDQ